jgi:hypothetical protein
MVMWFGDGASFSAQSLNRTYGPGWRNARSLGFESRSIMHSDFNADGRSDLLWQNEMGDGGEAWQMSGVRLQSAYGFNLPSGYRIMTTGDFNGDGQLDLFATSAARDMVMWFGNGRGFAAQSLGRTYGPGWSAVGRVDFNKDGISDLLWRNDQTGQFETWVMNGITLVSGRGFQLPPNYRVATVGDFNGDGISDLFLTSPSRDMVMWFGTGTSFTGQSLNRTYGVGWKPVGQIDFNADGKDDLLWHSNGQFEAWVMDGIQLTRARGFGLPNGYQVIDAGDYNGDGYFDLFLTSSARDMVMWFGDGASFSAQSLNRTYGPGWSTVSVISSF